MSKTSTIIVENNDSQIWNRDTVIVDITAAIKKDQDIVVHLNNEGPCAESLGLYQILDTICEKLDYSADRVTVVTCNQLEQHPVYRIVRDAPMKHVETLQRQLKEAPAEYKLFDRHTKHFGHFIGHGNKNRLIIGSQLHAKYLDKTIQTYHCDVKQPYHRSFIHFEDLMFGEASQQIIDCAYQFLKTTPIKFELDAVDTYPIRDYKMYGINSAYPFIFVDIIAQTYCTGNTFYLDEKLWRPIMTKTPFIVQGPQNFIENFKRLGFKTFDQWWSEGYSEDPSNHQPYEILSIVNALSKLTIDELSRMYNGMKPVLDHNYNRFLTLTAEDFAVFK